MKNLSILLASLSLCLLACRGGGGGGGDDQPPADMPPGGQTHIQDVQNDNMPKGTAVSLKGVIVTAIDAFGARTGDLWVEEPGGGEFSGIKVFGAPLDQVAQLQPGDIVDITNAEKDEFALSTDMTGRTVTELKGAAGGMMTITKTGTGTVPSPAPVDALAIDGLPDQAAKDAEWEKWEGVLINVSHAKQLTALTGFGGMAEDQFGFDATGGLTVETVLADLTAVAVVGTCYQSMTGIGDYFFDYLLLPRASADLVGGGSGCAAETVAKISDIQAGTVTGAVKIEDVFVMAIDFAKRSFWISSSLTAAPNEGVFVFGNAALDAAVVPGAKVTVLGTTQEFNDDAMGGALTEITGPGITVTAGTPGTPVAVTGKTVAQLLDAATAPTFESVLVTLTNVDITALGSNTNGFIATAKQSGQTFGVGTNVLRLVTDQLGCYTSITGFWTNLQAAAAGATTKPNAFGFIPVTLGTKGTGCN
jgi:hypothetical protein